MSARDAVVRAAVLLAMSCAPACGDIFHATNWSICDREPGSAACQGTGAGAGEGGSASDGGTGVGGDSSDCTPAATRDCYTGPAGTADVGECSSGTETCEQDGLGWGPCEGEILPEPEDCETAIDEDCGGDANAGCPARSCAELLAERADLADGVYEIDPDGGAGPLAPVETFCDMTTEGGGWTLLAKTIKAGLTADEMATVRESFWDTYAHTGYGSAEPASRIYWMPLTHWNVLTTNNQDNELVSRTGTTDVRVTTFAVADEAGKFAWTWAAPTQGFLGIVAELKGASFTARDADNDSYSGNCSVDNVGLNGGFWYMSCHQLSMLHVSGNVYRLDSNIATAVELNEIYLR